MYSIDNMLLQTVTCVWLFLAQYFFLSAGCTYTTINTREHQVIFHYSQEIRSEKNLPICDETSVCSVLHKRYWLPPIADRLCRCVDNDECPWRWATEPNNYTMMLNNRAQLKFCSPINHLKQCDSHSTALTTETLSGQGIKTRFNVKVECSCSSHKRWKHFSTTQHITTINSTTTVRTEYKCSPLKRCHTLEVCGNVRPDYNSIYYSCSCPLGHFCEYKDKSLYNVEELLYKGSAYKALCVPYDENVEYDY